MSPSSPDPRRALPERPSLEQLRKQAKGLLRDARAGDASALARLTALAPVATNGRIALADAQFVIAREYGFPSWPKLVHHVEAISGSAFVLRPLIRPVEMVPGGEWMAGSVSADDAYAMFVAARDGDFATVKRLVARNEALATIEYNYTPPIHFAVREGHRDITEFLLDHIANPAYRSYPFKESLLTFAEDRGHADVAQLLSARLSRRFAFEAGTQVLLGAAEDGNLAAVESELARNPALARASDETGDTPLHQAAKIGHLEIVRALLAAGANVDAVRGDGYRPIHCALMPNWFYQTQRGDRADVELLLSSGARYTILIAALRGDMEFVERALAGDRSLANFEDSCHQRVLSAAVRRGDIAMTRLLLDHGADPNLPEEGGPRGLSLWIAVDARQHELVRMLLEHGADPNADVESSGTPMSRARMDPVLAELLSRYGGRPVRPNPDRIAQLLEERRMDEAEAFFRDNPQLIHSNDAGWGDGILAGPARDGRHDVIEMLLRLGARIPLVSKWAPYYYFKHEATAALLLERGMNPDHMNWHRFTLLHHMAAEGEVGKARLLIAHGANIDAIDDEYRSTPLGVAARRGQLAMVKLLLENGADPLATGAPWAVPLSWAVRKGHAHIAELLGTVVPRE